MISKKVLDLLNKQINMELFSGYLYYEIANFYKLKSLPGFANWFNVQMKEEWEHALLIRNLLLNADHKVELEAIDNPTTEFNDFREPLQASYDHEVLVSSSIKSIYKIALEEEDFRTLQFLNWFIQEQGEEEKITRELIRRYDLHTDQGNSLYDLDNELGEREFEALGLELEEY